MRVRGPDRDGGPAVDRSLVDGAAGGRRGAVRGRRRAVRMDGHAGPRQPAPVCRLDQPHDAVGLALFAALVLLFIDVVGPDRRPDADETPGTAEARAPLRLWLLVALVLFAAAGAKASLLPLLFVGLLAVVVGVAVSRRRLHRDAGIGLGLTGVGLVLAIVLLFRLTSGGLVIGLDSLRSFPVVALIGAREGGRRSLPLSCRSSPSSWPSSCGRSCGRARSVSSSDAEAGRPIHGCCCSRDLRRRHRCGHRVLVPRAQPGLLPEGRDGRVRDPHGGRGSRLSSRCGEVTGASSERWSSRRSSAR